MSIKPFRFRSPEEWKSAILTLPDSAYFELLRSVFGNIKTPFNKHKLMEDLSAFLTRREIQETIAAYIDETDHRIIAAIAALDEPAPGVLESFFAGEYSFVELHGLLINLEERLIVYRFQDKGMFHLALNPLLEPVLAPFAADKGALFPSDLRDGAAELAALPPVSESLGAVGPVMFSPPDDRIFAALIAFVSGQAEFYKSEGGMRKRTAEDGRLLFPALKPELLIEGLLNVGLLTVEGLRLIPDRRRIGFFGRLSLWERLEYWAAGIYIAFPGREPVPQFFHRGRIQTLARFIHQFTAVLEPGRRYPRQTLRRIAEILERQEEPTVRWAESGTATFIIGPTGIDTLLEAMEKVGLIRAAEADVFYVADMAGDNAGAPAGRPVMAMDTAFSCILYPEISYDDAMILASFCAPRETGAVVRFELTRESVVRGFDMGLDAAAMTGHLERLSGKEAAQNLHWTLNDWEERYNAVSVHQGTILTLSEDRRYLAQTGHMASLISRTLAPGVYLLAIPEKDAAVQALQKAGVDIIAQPPLLPGGAAAGVWQGLVYGGGPGGPPGFSPYPSTEGRFGSYREGNLLSTLIRDAPDRADPSGASLTEASRTAAAEACKERFRTALRKTRLPKEDIDELTARIDRRLIVSESQLAGGAVRHEKLEARNLDYVGKTVVAKQAIALQSMVEVLWSGPNGGENRLLGIPKGMEKNGGETILVLKPVPRHEPSKQVLLEQVSSELVQEEPGGDGEVIRLPLGKIRLLRRIKQSIFGE